jgi:transcriptional regulator with XRE-family HTH domain
VPGLRREELALLAGMSVTWYTQLEAGTPITVSPALLRRLSDTLGLSELERAYLFSLAIDEFGILSSLVADLEMLAGSRIAASSLADEIGMVVRTHRSLKAQIYGALVHGTTEALKPHVCEDRCPIGIWLHDDLSPAYRRSAHYERAARIHAAFHLEISRVVSSASAGDTMSVEQLVAAPGAYARMSSLLEHEFRAWRSTVSANAGSSA